MTETFVVSRDRRTDGTWAHNGRLTVRRRLATGALASVTLPDDWTTLTVADGSITSAKIADGTIQNVDLAPGVAAANVGALGGVLTGTLPSPGLAANSVDTSKIVDGTIATADLAAHAVSQTGLATVNSGSTTSTSYVDIVGLTVTLTTTGGDLLALASVGTYNSAAANDVYLALNLDGADTTLASIRSPGIGYPVMAPLAYRWAAPAAGSHTVKVRWQTVGTQTINANITSALLVVELKR